LPDWKTSRILAAYFFRGTRWGPPFFRKFYALWDILFPWGIFLTEGPFKTKREAGAFSLEDLKWAAKNGIMSGCGGGSLKPKGLAARAQAAAVLMRYMENQGR